MKMMNDDNSLLCLGRIGDVITALPIAYDMAKRSGKPVQFVSSEFALVLEGCSYVEPVIYPGSYKDVHAAKQWAFEVHGLRPRIAQWYGWTTEKKERNFQREAWRIAGYGDKWGTLPTVFDRRNMEREERLNEGRSWSIALALDSHSSPLPGPLADYIVVECSDYIGPCNIIALGSQAERFYDVLGLLDQARVLITADTAALHLSRASRCPVIAIVNDRDGGWWASEPPPNCIHVARYSEGLNMIHGIMAAVKRTTTVASPAIYHCSSLGPQNGRTLPAWSSLLDPALGELVCVSRHMGGAAIEGYRKATFTAKAIGDPRDLPTLKAVLRFGLNCAGPGDIVLWTNDDTDLGEYACEILQQHVPLYGACSVRRDDAHMGRELFAFTREWLAAHIDQIPDFFIGAPQFDLVLAAMIRKERGIVTTLKNLAQDFFPCELSNRIAIHEDHPSSWTKYESAPANVHNKRLAREWFAANGMPIL